MWPDGQRALQLPCCPGLLAFPVSDCGQVPFGKAFQDASRPARWWLKPTGQSQKEGTPAQTTAWSHPGGPPAALHLWGHSEPYQRGQGQPLPHPASHHTSVCQVQWCFPRHVSGACAVPLLNLTLDAVSFGNYLFLDFRDNRDSLAAGTYVANRNQGRYRAPQIYLFFLQGELK